MCRKPSTARASFDTKVSPAPSVNGVPAAVRRIFIGAELPRALRGGALPSRESVTGKAVCATYTDTIVLWLGTLVYRICSHGPKV